MSNVLLQTYGIIFGSILSLVHVKGSFTPTIVCLRYYTESCLLNKDENVSTYQDLISLILRTLIIFQIKLPDIVNIVIKITELQ